MTRPTEDESGPKQNVSIRLSPSHLTRLDDICKERDNNRSQIIAKLIDRVAPR